MRWIALLLWLVACYTVGAIGGWWAVSDLADWYRTLTRPRITPPTWVVGPVWIILYAMMAIAAWQVWLSPASALRSRGLTLFIVQLALNLIWPWIFFRGHDLGAAVTEVILLWIAVGATTLVFREIAPRAAWLMAPYWAWVSFAVVVGAAFWRSNRDQA